MAYELAIQLLDASVKRTIDAYVQYRENKAIGEYALKVIENRIEQ
tara:strand:- start:1197 stop:1331 length:135 start_codon:yes stop_codon:yes gene_type:complete